MVDNVLLGATSATLPFLLGLLDLIFVSQTPSTVHGFTRSAGLFTAVILSVPHFTYIFHVISILDTI